MLQRVTQGAGSPYFTWTVEMVFRGANQQRELGYRAEGTIKNQMSKVIFIKEPQVHDEKRPVWTTMNLLTELMCGIA